MKNFDGIPFLWALIGGLVLVAIFGLRAWLGRRRVRVDARADYEYKQSQKMIPAGISQEVYETIYMRVFGPRGQIYICAGMVGILIATPIAMVVLEQGLNFIYNNTGQSRVIEPGFLVWQFYIFFGVLAAWVAVAYWVARRYHRTAPGSLQFELDSHLYGGEDYVQPF